MACGLFLGLLACQRSGVDPMAGRTVEIEFTVKPRPGAEVASRVLISGPSKGGRKGLAPLLVALHGHGGNAAAFHDLWRSTADSLGLVLVTPQGEAPVQSGHWSWGDAASAVVHRAITLAAQQILVNPRQVYLAGFSQGGNLAYRLAAQSPSRYAGVAALGAPFHAECFSAVTKSRTRFYIGTGREDALLWAAQEAMQLLTPIAAGVQLDIYEGVGHGLPQPMDSTLIRLMQWLLPS